MTLMTIPKETVRHLRKTQNRRATLCDYADLPNSAVYWPSTGELLWEATVTHDNMVTVRRVDGSRLDSLDDDIVHGDDVFTGFTSGTSPKELAHAINRVRRSRCKEVE